MRTNNKNIPFNAKNITMILLISSFQKRLPFASKTELFWYLLVSNLIGLTPRET